MSKENEEQKDINVDNQTPEEEQILTITPAMLDSEGDEEKKNKIDLTAIIPNSESATASSEAIQLTSKEKELKTDGTVIIGFIKNEDEAEVKLNVVLPEQIDISKRKEEIKKNKRKKQNKKEAKKRVRSKELILQNRMSIVALIAIIIIVGTVLYITTKPTEKGFKALTIEVELGDKLPTSVSTYVKPGIGTTVNEMAYNINTNDVRVDVIGEYRYTVTYKNTKKQGIIKVVDKTPPKLTLRENVSIVEGQEYTPETFVYDCLDYSGCNYSFEDKDTTTKYTKPGKYTIHIVATDAYNNKELKQAVLNIEAVGMVKKYKLLTPYDETKGYSVEDIYDLHFADFANQAIILNGTRTVTRRYEDEEKFKADKKLFYGELNYTIDDKEKTIVETTAANTVGYNYGEMEDVHTFLIGQGYSEV